MFLHVLLSFFYSNAQIVYTDISPDIISVMTTNPGYQINVCPIDFNNDGVSEYNFRWDDWGSTLWFMHFTFNNNNNNKIAIFSPTSPNPFNDVLVKPLLLNNIIDQNLNWGTSIPEPFIGNSDFPNFLGLGDRYIGVRFNIGQNLHYGWVLVSFETFGSSRRIVIKSYAYNTIPNQSILAGQTSNLNNNDYEINNFKIYPNPVVKTLQIHNLSDSSISKIFIFNGQGQNVYESIYSMSNLDLSSMVSGIYFISIINDEGNVETHKFIKI